MRTANRQTSWARCEQCGDLFIASVRESSYQGAELYNLLRGMLIFSIHEHFKRGECAPCGPSTRTAA